MMQDMFKRTPLEAGAVVSLISLFNAGGRFMWASGSDYIGRRNTYTIDFDALRQFPRWSPGEWKLPPQLVDVAVAGLKRLSVPA